MSAGGNASKQAINKQQVSKVIMWAVNKTMKRFGVISSAHSSDTNANRWIYNLHICHLTRWSLLFSFSLLSRYCLVPRWHCCLFAVVVVVVWQYSAINKNIPLFTSWLKLSYPPKTTVTTLWTAVPTNRLIGKQVIRVYSDCIIMLLSYYMIS